MSAEEEEEALDRLLFHLENQTGFWFGLVVSDDPRPRARLCEAAKAWCEENGKGFFLHEPEPSGLVTLAVALASEVSPGVHWIRADGVKAVLDAWSAGAAQMLMAMNERREAYRQRLDGGIVVEGRLSLKRILREMAPDLFSVRAFIAEPGEEAKTRPGDFPDWRSPMSLTALDAGADVDPEQAFARLARLSSLEGEAKTQRQVEAEWRVVVSLFNAERYEEARDHAGALLLKIVESREGTPTERAHLRAQIYNVLARLALFQQGDVAEAKRLWEQALDCLLACSEGEEMDRFRWFLLWLDMTKNLAEVSMSMGDFDAAQAVLERFVGSLSDLPTRDLFPETQVDLVDVYLSLARIHEHKHELLPAEDAIKKAVSLAEECMSLHPEDDRRKFEVLRSRAALGRIHALRNDANSAFQALVDVAPLAEKLELYGAVREPWGEALEMYHVLLGFLLSGEEGYSKANDLLRVRALSGMRARFERSPDDVRFGWLLAGCYLSRAKLLATEDVAGAKDSAQQALDLAARLPVNEEREATLKSEIDALRAFVGDSPARRRSPRR
jgi:tetratricopeptide (TPR) repeat protein